MKYSASYRAFAAAGALGMACAAGTAASPAPVSSLSLVPGGLLAGTAGAGVWKRDGASGRWTRLTNSQRELAIGAVAAAPSDPDVVYAGAAADVYRSDDGGSTWTTVTALPGSNAAGSRTSSIAVDPTNPNIVWAGGTLGVFRSDTAGASWATIESIGPNAIAPVVALELDPSDTNVAYYTDSRHVWKYDAAAGSPPLDVSPRARNGSVAGHPAATYVIALAIAPSNHEILYAAYAFSGNVNANCSAGLYRTTDGGAHWQTIPVAAGDDYFSDAYSSGTGTQCDGAEDNAIAVDPLDSNHVVAGGIALAEFTFSSSSTVLHVQRNLSAVSHAPSNHHALAFDAAGDLYDASDGGVWYFPRSAFAPGSADPGMNLNLQPSSGAAR
jgi:hypothetical protein